LAKTRKGIRELTCSAYNFRDSVGFTSGNTIICNFKPVIVNGYHRTGVANRRTVLSSEQIEAISRAVADPRRFAILQSIAARPCTPCSAVREQHPISPATISHHVKELEAAGLIALEREGRTMRMVFQRDLWNQYVGSLADI
jgi:ArsR family transcriptional regulator, arsenate/arsenite/antimonite-responsive transcriptional repressor